MGQLTQVEATKKVAKDIFGESYDAKCSEHLLKKNFHSGHCIRGSDSRFSFISALENMKCRILIIVVLDISICSFHTNITELNRRKIVMAPTTLFIYTR